MKRILITGMSGTGKSSVIERLSELDYKAIDTDDDYWCEWRLMPVPGTPPGTPTKSDWVWREDRIRCLLETEDDATLFVSGCRSNQGRFRDRFDHVVLLTALITVMRDRIVARTINPYGKSAEERARIIEHTRVVLPLLRGTADVEIDTASTPLREVVTQVLLLADIP